MFTARNKQAWLWAATTILGLSVVRLTYTGVVRSQNPASKVVPYTVLRTESSFDQGGTLQYTNQYIEAIRSDGSAMWEGITDKARSRKISFANGDHVRTNEILGRRSTYTGESPGPVPQRSPDAQCATPDDAKGGWVPGARETIAGHQAVSMVQGGGKRTMTVWYALDAGCAEIQLRLVHETGVTEQNLSSLVLGEPSAALFQVPSSFQEGPPSWIRGYCPDAGGVCRLEPALKAKIDRSYYALR